MNWRALCADKSIAQEMLWARPVWGWALFETGQRERGLAEVAAGLSEQATSHNALLRPYYLQMHAELLLQLNRVGRGRSPARRGPHGEPLDRPADVCRRVASPARRRSCSRRTPRTSTRRRPRSTTRWKSPAGRARSCSSRVPERRWRRWPLVETRPISNGARTRRRRKNCRLQIDDCRLRITQIEPVAPDFNQRNSQSAIRNPQSAIHRSSDTGFQSSSAKRDGLSGLVSSVVASPSRMISASRCPSAGACITPWPDDPLIR